MVNIFLLGNDDDITNIINKYYKMYEFINNEKFNSIVNKFISGNLEEMYIIIFNLLLLDIDRSHIASLLFNMLKNNKTNSIIIQNIIYDNLPYELQILLKKYENNMNDEIEKIKQIDVCDIPIEQKLICNENLPDEAKKYILEKKSELSGENNYKIKIAIDGLFDFPWKPSSDNTNLFSGIANNRLNAKKFIENFATNIDENIYGHYECKKTMIKIISKWIQNPISSGQSIGLVGHPGTGKTLFAKCLSKTLNIPMSTICVGGMSESNDLLGHNFTYATAQYGMIIRQIIKAGNWRSIIYFDEIDKTAKKNDINEIQSALIHLTDPNTNKQFNDRFYSSSINFDISGILFIFSYNDSSRIDPILLNRIQEINIPPYSFNEKLVIARDYIIPELCADIGIDNNKIYISDTTLSNIIVDYTMEAGVRDLRQNLLDILTGFNTDRIFMRGPFKQLIKKNNKNVKIKRENSNQFEKFKNYPNVEDSKEIDDIYNFRFPGKIEITLKYVKKYLPIKIIYDNKIKKINQIGVVNALYSTCNNVGGIIQIQMCKNYYNTSNDYHTLIPLKITGNQKNVMQESINCALTCVLNYLNDDIRESITKKFPYGFHIHTPDAGTPKDGPSAGIAFLVAFISIITGKKINHEIALTGEIDILGNIYKIGSLDSKLIGAKKAGIKTVYICEDNIEEYEKLKKNDPDLFNNFEVCSVNTIIDIITNTNILIDISPDFFKKI